MRDYEEFPDSLSLNSLFYIGNPQNLNLEIFKKLHDSNFTQKQFFSLEKLIKGKQKALVIFGPRELVKNFPELNLVEIEDYIGDEVGQDFEKKVNVNQVLSWLIEPKNNPKKVLHIGEEMKNLSVEDGQKIFIQSVLMPIGNTSEQIFQATLRVMVADPDPIKRVELAKKVDQIFSASTGLNKHEDNFPEGKKFDSFKQRSLIPKEVAEFPLTEEEVLSLLTA